MGQYSLVTVSRTSGGYYRKVKGEKSEVASGGEHIVRHYQIDNFIDDLPKVLTTLYNTPREVLLTWSSKVAHNSTINRRSKSELGTDYSHSSIGIIDIDEINGKPIENDGRPVEAQVNSILEKHLPYEILQVSRVVKMSSSWYTDKKIKFHVYFKLSEPVTHGNWASFCKVNIPIADEHLINNSSQIAFSAKPKGTNEDIALFIYDGDELQVDKEIYKEQHKINRYAAASMEHGIKLKDIEVTKKALNKKLDMSCDSHVKSFRAFVDAISLGYNSSVMEDMISQLNDRGGKPAERVKTQSQSAMKYVLDRCTDSFYKTEAQVLNETEYVDLSNLTPNNDGKTVNLIKGVTGIGKTQAMTKFCSEKSVVVVGQTRLLIHQNAKDFNAYPIDQSVAYGTDLSIHNSISTTIHSIYKLADILYSKKYEVLFIDEAAQTLKSWLGLGDEEKFKVLEAIALLFSKCKYVVLADADLTETAIQGYEKLLGYSLNKVCRNIVKKDFVGRDVFIYETKGEVLDAYQQSLNEGKKCLGVVDNRDYLHNKIQKTFESPNRFFFSRDTEEEPSHINFRKETQEFVGSVESLFCSPLLKSGVSFVNVFDEVFVIIDGDSFTSRDIIQILSRERKWKKVHIYTNTKKLAIQKLVENANKFDETLVMINEDIRQQVLIRPFDIAYRLDNRGANVTFLPCNHTKLKSGDIELPKYIKKDSDGRSAYEKFIFKFINNRNLNTAQKIKDNHEHIKQISGFDIAVSCPLRFYDWIQENQKLKGQFGSQFMKFSKSLKSFGIDDNDFFIEAKFTNKTRPKQQQKLKQALEGYYLSFDSYQRVLEQLNEHSKIMGVIDRNPELIKVEEDILDIQDSLESIIDL